MTDPKRDEKEIFLAALEITSSVERDTFLAKACGADAELLARVNELLASHEGSLGVLDAPPPALADGPTVDQPPTNLIGTKIGPYKLREMIGEGGMGTVYVAEQKQPVRRRVALKIIKPGMDSRQVIARFETERQALAMMDHPNIAKVHDAGTTPLASPPYQGRAPGGLPYFIMELVNGLPITKHCDEQHLSPRQRLELFIPICQAVQHAHQKGIIHRDLKPSNILVALYDGQPVPKVIDFGVAKATGQSLSDQSVYTQLGQLVGTLEYMSPEQAERNQLDIDTRSDIYSLGVVLYELLTGETPFERKRLHTASFDEMLRIIREEEPPRPSTKLSSSQSLPTVAANRQMEPRQLSALVRGELDWIVMKALEKDRSRRYESANGFAADVQRYLNGEAVMACPPSRSYRFRKFVRRNKVALITSMVIAIALLLGIAGTGWQAILAFHAADRASRAEQSVTKQRDLAKSNLRLALDALDNVYVNAIGRQRLLGPGEAGLGYLAITAREQVLLGSLLDFYSELAKSNDASGEAVFETAVALSRTGLLHRDLRELESAKEAFDQAIAQFTELLAIDPENTDYLRELGRTHLDSSYASEWLPNAEDDLAAAEKYLTRLIELNPNDSEAYSLRGDVHELRSRWTEAAKDLEQAVRLDPNSPARQMRLAIFLNFAGSPNVKDHAKSRQHLKTAVELDPENASYIAWLGRLIWEWDADRQQAIAELDRAVQLDPSSVIVFIQRAITFNFMGEPAKALIDINRALQLHETSSYYSAYALRQRGNIYVKLKQYDEALADYLKSEKFDPHINNLYEVRAGLHLRMENYVAAIEDFSLAIELNPDRGILFRERGIAYAKAARPQEALQDFERAIERNLGAMSMFSVAMHHVSGEHEKAQAELDRRLGSKSDKSIVYFDYAFALYKFELLDRAIDAYQEAAQLGGRASMTALWNEASIYAENNDKERAFETLSKLIDKGFADSRQLKTDVDLAKWRDDPQFVEMLKNIEWKESFEKGRRSVSQGNLDEAIVNFTRAIELNPKIGQPWNARALVFSDLGRWDQAISDLQRAVELAPQVWQPRHFLALAQLGAGDAEGYRNTCQAMVKTFAETKNAESAAFVAWTCALRPNALEDWEPALNLARLATRLQPKSRHYQNTLGTLLMRAGDTEEAIYVLTEVAKQLDEPTADENSEPAYSWYALTLAYLDAGKIDDAQKWRERADLWVKQKFDPQSTNQGSNKAGWMPRLVLGLLRNETQSRFDAK